MKAVSSLSEQLKLSGSVGAAEWRMREQGSGRDDSEGEEEPQESFSAESKTLRDRLLLENVSYALQARLAFSPYLTGATMDAVIPYSDKEPKMPEALLTARVLLQRAVLQRLRELQLLVDWPLLRPASTEAQMERLLAGGAGWLLPLCESRQTGSRPSVLVGARSGPPLEQPRLPAALQGLCLLGPMDLAVALSAGGAPLAQQQQLGKLDWMPLAQTGRGGMAGVGAAAATASAGGAAAAWVPDGLLGWVSCLPRSLGLLPGLPAVSSLSWAAPGVGWLREFFRELHPRQRHVGVDDRSLPWFRDVKAAAARDVVEEGGARAAAAFAVFGVPHGLRAAVWETALGLRRPPAGAAEGGGGGGGSRSGSGSGSGFGFGSQFRGFSYGAFGKSGGGSDDDAERFERLCAQALEQPLLLDVALCEDVGPAVADCEAFFLFQESIRAVLLAFQRDSQVLKRLAAPPLALLHATNAVHAVLAQPPSPPQPLQPPPGHGSMEGGEGGGGRGDGDGDGGTTASSQQETIAGGAGAAGATGSTSRQQPYYPPSGVLPYRGISLLAAPLCYMYDDTAASYVMFRALYCRYWSKLHSLSPRGLPSPALPGLLRVFESLLQELDPPLVTHLSRLGLLPATLVLPWLTTAFAGALPVQEVLLLWDRIIGLDSLLPLPLLAVAVLCFRRHVLLSCSSVSEVVSALSDVTQLRAVPLLQAVLFPGPGQQG